MKKLIPALLLLCGSAFGQYAPTPNIGLEIPSNGSTNWNIPLNYNFNRLDQLLSGNLPLPNLAVTGNVTVGGTVTANAFVGVGGSAFALTHGSVPGAIPWFSGTGGSSTTIDGVNVSGIPFYPGGTAPVAATFSRIVNLWASGSCTGFLKNDGTCTNAVVSIPGTAGQMLYTDGSALAASAVTTDAVGNITQPNGTSFNNYPTVDGIGGDIMDRAYAVYLAAPAGVDATGQTIPHMGGVKLKHNLSSAPYTVTSTHTFGGYFNIISDGGPVWIQDNGTSTSTCMLEFTSDPSVPATIFFGGFTSFIGDSNIHLMGSTAVNHCGVRGYNILKANVAFDIQNYTGSGDIGFIKEYRNGSPYPAAANVEGWHTYITGRNNTLCYKEQIGAGSTSNLTTGYGTTEVDCDTSANGQRAIYLSGPIQNTNSVWISRTDLIGTSTGLVVDGGYGFAPLSGLIHIENTDGVTGKVGYNFDSSTAWSGGPITVETEGVLTNTDASNFSALRNNIGPSGTFLNIFASLFANTSGVLESFNGSFVVADSGGSPTSVFNAAGLTTPSITVNGNTTTSSSPIRVNNSNTGGYGEVCFSNDGGAIGCLGQAGSALGQAALAGNTFLGGPNNIVLQIDNESTSGTTKDVKIVAGTTNTTLFDLQQIGTGSIASLLNLPGNEVIAGTLVVNSVGTSPSTAVICANGTGGIFTTLGCSSGLSGMTSGQVAIAGSSTSITSSKILAGVGAGIATEGTGSTSAGCVTTYSDTVGTLQCSGTALAALAILNSPGFSGTPTTPTQTFGDNTTKIASDAFVQAAAVGALGGTLSTGNVSLGTGAGTSPTSLTIAGTDANFHIGFTTGAAPTANGTLFTVNFTATRNHTCYATIDQSANAQSIYTSIAQFVEPDSTSISSISFRAGSSLPSATSVVFNVSCP